MEQKIFMSIRATAKASGLSENYLRREFKAGRLPAIKVGCKALVNYPQLMALLEQKSVGREA